ncbi:MAG: site-specific integrase [Desulfovibrio sp.]|uniref:site-specific integrase n=1 Tax=Desulfovibrio sp. TaxID=885 RepID=UPI002A91DE6E|nr:site-specific integrase [Desulfovibrio sp.]MDY6234837.1 site-specific integrase [Desulfovibrio sp.]
MDEQEQERLLALYPDESLKAALEALNTPPAEDEAQARKEWQEQQELMQELEGPSYTPKEPPLFFPPSARYKERLRRDASLFIEAAPLCLRDGDVFPMLGMAEAFLARHGYAMPPASGEDDSPQAAAVRSRFRKIFHQLLAEEWQVKKLFLAHLDGEAWASMRQPALVTAPLPPHGTGQSPAQAGAVPGGDASTQEGPDNPRFSKVCEAYIREKGAGLAPSSLLSVQLAVRRFMEQAGDLPIKAYRKREHIIRYKDALLALPKNLPAPLAKLPMPTVLERIRKGAFPHLQQAPKLSARTINEKYLAFVQVVFSYAVNNGLVEVNPCTGVRAASNTTELEDVSVLPFSKEDLSVIFQRSGLYHPHGCGAVGRLYASKSKLLDYRWLVLLALYTGARIEELAQLDRQDVRQEAGVWFIHIRAEMATGRRVKNRASIRKVPLHSRLLELGFLDFARQGEGTGKLFPLLSDKQDGGKRSNAFSQWWRRFLASLDLENGDRKHFHSFRHTFKREGRNSGQIAPELLDALQGHAQQGVSANYGRDEEGKQYALPVLQEALEKIDFSDVTQGLESSMML